MMYGMKPLESEYCRCRNIEELNHYHQPDDFYNPVTHVYEFFDKDDTYHYYRPDFVGSNGDIVIKSDRGIYKWCAKSQRWFFNHIPVKHFTDVDCPQLLLEAFRVSVGSEKIDRIHSCLLK